ncbi:MAG: PglZ domain-containing protein [Peptococcaceae bacterium MAG4]|nr:PglZ domain-containing protein [Peptococcaceae bacterium MAG4]
MERKWYHALVNKINKSYHDLIIVIDHDRLSWVPELRSALQENFAVHDYRGELSLRRFLKEQAGRRVLVFKPPEMTYLPYDIEAGSDVIGWQLSEVFPKLHPAALRNLPVEHYQTAYAAYREMESSLKTLDAEETQHLVAKWLAAQAGTRTSYKEDSPLGSGNSCKPDGEQTEYRCRALCSKVEELLQQDSVDWRALAPLWGELSFWLCHSGIEMANIRELDRRISERFKEFILASYNDLFYESYITRPATVDKVLPYLGCRPASKKALICMDGMGFQEWYCLKRYLAGLGVGNFCEKAVFALLPTLTKVSRRALFCGQHAIKEQVEEEKGFLTFIRRNWPGGKDRPAGVFLNIDGAWRREYMDYDYLGLIYNLVDDIAHNTINVKDSKELMQKNLAMHLEKSGFGELVGKLLEKGFQVYLTSDHGSVWCRGNGHQAVRWLVEDRARRALMFQNHHLAEDFAAGKNVLVYRNSSLFGKMVAVFPSNREMFGDKDDTAISHGGINIEEVIVPFVEVKL